jgi:hypothetical protein
MSLPFSSTAQLEEDDTVRKDFSEKGPNFEPSANHFVGAETTKSSHRELIRMTLNLKPCARTMSLRHKLNLAHRLVYGGGTNSRVDCSLGQ